MNILWQREEKEHFRQIEIMLEGNSCLMLLSPAVQLPRVSWPHPDTFRALSFLLSKHKVLPSSLRPLRQREKRKKSSSVTHILHKTFLVWVS